MSQAVRPVMAMVGPLMLWTLLTAQVVSLIATTRRLVGRWTLFPAALPLLMVFGTNIAFAIVPDPLNTVK